jgi:hypothetical protein
VNKNRAEAEAEIERTEAVRTAEVSAVDIGAIVDRGLAIRIIITTMIMRQFTPRFYPISGSRVIAGIIGN